MTTSSADPISDFLANNEPNPNADPDGDRTEVIDCGGALVMRGAGSLEYNAVLTFAWDSQLRKIQLGCQNMNKERAVKGLIEQIDDFVEELTTATKAMLTTQADLRLTLRDMEEQRLIQEAALDELAGMP
jgi:hypothetical protein